MKSIFFLILAVNILFFAHQHLFDVNKSDEKSFQGVREGANSPKSLFLLSERTGLNPSERGSVESVSVSSVEPASIQNESTSLCTMIGPYAQLLQAEYTVERLAALGADVHIVPIEIKEGESFWVYLGPEISEREVLNKLYELQKKNIESHIISKGELANGISFGRFSGHQEAELLAQRVRGAGYDAQIRIMPKTVQETWVVVGDGFAEKIDGFVWEELLRKQKGLEKRQNYCLGVASH